MATTEMNCLASGGGATIEPISGTLPGSTNITIPTTRKAKGFLITAVYNNTKDDIWSFDGENASFIGQNGANSPWTTATFGDNSITLNNYYSSATCSYSGYIIY